MSIVDFSSNIPVIDLWDMDKPNQLSTSSDIFNIRKSPVIIDVKDYQWYIHCNLKLLTDEVMQVSVSAKLLSRYIFSDKTYICIIIQPPNKRQSMMFFELASASKTQIIEVNRKISSNDELAETNVLVYITINSEISDIKDHLTSPNRPHDIVIEVGHHLFYLLKQYLATWSAFFDRQFFGAFSRRNQEKIVFDSTIVDQYDFLDLLKFIHRDSTMVINDSNAIKLLKLAIHFEMPSVIVQCGVFLEDFGKNKDFSLMDRLELADEYNIRSLLIACFNYIHALNVEEQKKFFDENEPRLCELSTDTLNNIS